MYTINVFDYNNKFAHSIYTNESFYNTLSVVESMLLDYVENKQGCKTIDYKDLFYSNNNTPLFRGKSVYYIKKSTVNCCKFTVIKRERLYGYLYNTFRDIKELAISISRCHPKHQSYKNNVIELNEIDKDLKTYYSEEVLTQLIDYIENDTPTTVL